MGCTSSRVAPVYDPIRVKTPASESIKTSSNFRQKTPTQRSQSTSSNKVVTNADDTDLLTIPLNHKGNDPVISEARITKNDDEFVEIEIADPQAFNESFIRQRRKAIDNPNYRSAIQSWQPKSLEQLVEYIKTLSKNKSLMDCHWIIFYWIATNIEYDVVSYFTKNYANQTAEGVFRTRKGVCAGYANIYQHLCVALNLPSEKVSGYAKGHGFDDRQGVPTETDHAWNAVEIDHHWYLVDATWGAGSLTEQNQFQQKLKTYYFLTRPNEMIYHHLPENEKWQLLKIPITMKQYLQMPKLRHLFFELNLDLISPRHQAHLDLLPEKSYAEVLIRTPSDVQLIGSIKLNGRKVEGGDQIEFDHKQGIYCCRFAPNTIGKHKITIYAKKSDEAGSFGDALDFNLTVNDTLKNPISFPTTWKRFFDLNMHIVKPKGTHIINVYNGETHAEVGIRTPDDVELLANLIDSDQEKVKGGHQAFYNRTEGIWRCYFAPNKDGIFEAQIFAKQKSDQGSSQSAVSFKIDAKNIPSTPLSYPTAWTRFFDFNMQIVKPKDTHLINVHNGETHAEVGIRTPDDVELLADLVDSDQEKVKGGHQAFYDRTEGIWRCNFAPNKDGIFEAQIFAKKISDRGSSQAAVSFKIDAKNIPSTPLSYPTTWPLFYELGLKIEAPRNRSSAVWPENASFSEVRLSAPNDVDFSCGIRSDGIKKENCALCQFDNDKQQWQFLFAPQNTGFHQLLIYARRQSDSNESFNSVVEFDLNVTKLHKRMTFPVTYTLFQSRKCRIYEPLDGTLKRDAIVPFHCIIPGAHKVGIQVDSNWVDTNVKRYEDPVLKTEIKVGSKDVGIYAKYDEQSNYNGLFRYSVQ